MLSCDRSVYKQYISILSDNNLNPTVIATAATTKSLTNIPVCTDIRVTHTHILHQVVLKVEFDSDVSLHICWEDSVNPCDGIQ